MPPLVRVMLLASSALPVGSHRFGPCGREVPGVCGTGAPSLGPLMLMLILASGPRLCLMEGGFEGMGVGAMWCAVHKALAPPQLVWPYVHKPSVTCTQPAICICISLVSLHTTCAA